jgi:hypothetical protein
MENLSSLELINNPPTLKRSRVDSEEDSLLRDEVESLKTIVEVLMKKISQLESQLQSQLPSQPIASSATDPQPVGSGPPFSAEDHRMLSPEPEPTRTMKNNENKEIRTPAVDQPSAGWEQVKTKTKAKTRSYREVVQGSTTPSGAPNQVPNLAKTSAKASGHPPSKVSLKSSLAPLSDDERLRVLLRKSMAPGERTAGVVVVSAALPLSREARLQPIVAWKQAIESLSGHRPLLVSLRSPCSAELLLDSFSATAVREALSKKGYLLENQPVLGRDLERRKQAYLRGYFRPLRRAALAGFSLDLQLKLLDLASKGLPKMADPLVRRQWQFQIAKDRSWVQEQVSGPGLQQEEGLQPDMEV